jgi:hypothetical protein
LILGIVAGAQQLPAASFVVLANARVVAGGQTLGADLPRHPKERLKLHIGIAIGASDRSAAGEILIHEGTHHARLELLLEIHDVMGKIQVLRDGFGIVNVVERAAPVLLGAVTLQFGETALIPELHGEADDGAALLLQQSGNSGRVHASGHGNSDEAALRFRALGQGVELECRSHSQNQDTMYRAPTIILPGSGHFSIGWG